VLAGIFTLVVGSLFLIVAFLQFKLHSELGAKFVLEKKTISRLPQIDPAFRQVKFKGFYEVSFETDYQYRYLGVSKQ